MNRIFNFSAGPATLPVPVLEEASRGVLEIANSGMSILEVSHRGPQYDAIHAETKERLLKLMGLSAQEYTPLFLGGGASTQFMMIPMNFLGGGTADYIHTGEWSSKAIKEAKRYGKVNLASSSEADKFARLEPQLTQTPGAKYIHITTNNTIEGTEWLELPKTGDTPLVADASSDFLSQDIDYRRFSLMYAGAQKNAGPAGVTIVVVKNSFLATAADDVPVMLSYKNHAKSDSLYNTPPVFPIYVFSLVLKWIEGQGGLKAVQAKNTAKAKLIYDALDQFPEVYEPVVKDARYRSRMNITFRLKNDAREKEFLKGAEERGMDGLKGHRSVGGLRASIYNAFPEEGARALASYLAEFAGR